MSHTDFRISCQTITFGDCQNSNMGATLAAVRGAGYDGVEIGYRRLGNVKANRLKDMLDNEGLALSAIHAGGNLEDKGQAGTERMILDAVLEYALHCTASFVIYSGLNGVAGAALKDEIDRLNRSAGTCGKNGVRLLYHNHNWEFSDSGRIMQALLRDSSPELGFCPDVGWLDKAGMDIVRFLDGIADRVAAIHFKDFASRSSQTDTVELGRGIVPFGPVVQWLKEHGTPSMWVVAEQDFTKLGASEAIRINADYLRTKLR